MKKKFLNTKNVVIGLVSLVLIGASATGVAVFLKDRGEAAAAEQEQVQNLPATGREEDNNQTGENTTIPSENNTTGDNTQIPTEPSTTEGATPGATTRPGTTGTTTRPRTEEAVAGIEETVRIEERKVFEDLKLSWTTLAIPAITADMGIFKHVLGIEKTATAVVRANQEEQIPVTENNVPMVRAGDTIIYTIKVSNSGNYKATNVVVTDSLDVIFDGQTVKANEELAKIETLDAGKQATLKVGYVVTQEDIEAVEAVETADGILEVQKNIENKAYATDGKTTVEDEDKTVPVNPDVEISVTKVWDDADNQDGIRPDEITINLFRNRENEPIQTQKIQAANKWEYEFKNLPKYDEDKNEIFYYVMENEVKGYETKYEETEGKIEIQNIHTPATTSITGSKTWDDAGNQDGKRPASITIRLLADGTEVDSKTVTAEDNWSWTFENKPVYANGTAIEYTITEDAVVEYGSNVSGYNVTNTHTPATTSITGSKTWIDEGIASKRPASITIRLLADGTEVDSKTVTANDNWSWTFANKPVYANGTEIEYTIAEDAVAEYGSNVSEYNVTNTIAQDYVSLSGNKIWLDPVGTKHDTITLQVYQNNKPYKVNGVDYSIKLADGATSFSFTGLPKYKVDSEGNYILANGKVQLNEYKVVETTGQTGYSVSYSTVTTDNDGNYTQNVTNSLEQTQISFTANKVWVDEGIVDNRKDITVELYKNNVATGKTLQIKKDEKTCTFDGLDRYTIVEENGEIKSITENIYSVQEKTTISGYDEPTYSEVTKNGAEWSQTITNTKTQEKISVEGTKTWKLVPEGTNLTEVEVKLLKDGKEVDSTTVTNGKYSFTDLDKFDMENNYREYEYTVKEVVPEGYVATYDGYNITNTKHITATKSAVTSTGVDEVNIGETINYTITITNNTEVATEVTVQDNIPGLNQGNVKVEVNGDITLEGKPLTEVEVQALYNGTFKVNMPATATRTIVIPIKVTAGMTGDKIKNTAYVNAEPTNEVINPIERTVAVTRYKNNLSSTNIILVLDVSSSMKGEKIKTAKQAVIDFIEKTYKTEENKDVTFTLITFAKREYTEGARGDQQGKKYKYHGGLFEFNDSGENKGKYEYGCGNSIITLQNHEDFKTAFEGLLTDRGTNMRAGLEVAYNTIYGEAENTLSKLYPNYDKIVIFFGDGEPYGEEELENNPAGIKEAAGWLKAKKAKVYSIGFGNGASEGTKGWERLKDISSDGNVYTSSNYTQLVKNFSDIVSADPVVYPYTIDGNAIIELTAETTQKIVVDEKNPIKIKIGDAEEILITDIATAEKYKITYTNKKIIWDVKEYSKDTNLRISYHVQ